MSSQTAAPNTEAAILARLIQMGQEELLPSAAKYLLSIHLGVATFWQRASATSQTERGASGLDQHGRASIPRNARRGKQPAAATPPRP
jgi:hypothetical protein